MKETVHRLLQEIYLDNAQALAILSRVITPRAGAITDTFYRDMMTVDAAIPFLNNRLVDERLRNAMSHWLIDLLTPRDEATFEAYVERQIEIGHVHARVNIPMSLVLQGVRILKREFCTQLLASDLPRAEMTEAVIIANDLLDTAALLINDSYLNDLVDNERNAQSMRLHLTNHNLAMECESLRSELFDWSRRILSALFTKDQHQLDSSDLVCHSEFGLWVTHKAELLFPDKDDVRKLRQQLETIDEHLARARSERDQGMGEAFQQAVFALNEAVTHAAWLIAELVEHAMEQEHVRDPLTKLLNRRYLPSIIQREVRLSIQQERPFAVLMVDVDHFKPLNDTHGHATGDAVLSQFSELLLSTMRASDFIFRYGGEEFLVLISDSNISDAERIAEKLRRRVESHTFRHNGTSLQLTCSIGFAVHDGHPDYSQVLAQADQALYRAKQNGRNRYEAAGDQAA